MKEQIFRRCNVCGNLVGMIEDAGIPLICCKQPMETLDTNPSAFSREKHTPVAEVERDRVRVTVGETRHPMENEHHIQWAYLQTSQGGQRHVFTPGKPAETVFLIHSDEQPLAVFAYCNQHGLWKQTIE